MGKKKLLSVAGASAGAMAAVLLSAGIHPKKAGEFSSDFKFSDFADPIGYFALLKGNKFELLMKDFLINNHNTDRKEENNGQQILSLEESIIPVAVTTFDIKNFKSMILTSGCMAKAARASATFPFLFQPTKWNTVSSSIKGNNSENITTTNNNTSYLIDGGLIDPHGLLGLTKTIINTHNNKR